MSAKHLGGWGIGLILAALFTGWWQRPDGRFHLIACDVGQGDATLLVRGRVQILVDGGPDNGRVVECLSRHLPFWDRTIELVLVSHMQADHAGGLVDVLERYRVKTLGRVLVPVETDLSKEIDRLARDREITLLNLHQGKTVKVGEMQLRVIWPPSIQAEATPADTNDASLVFRSTYNHFDALFTGDIEAKAEEQLVTRGLVEPVEWLKVAHHGAKTGTGMAFLELAQPKVAVIEVGAKNRYGHPAPEVVERLRQAGIAMRRTDERGDVEVVSDGRTFWYR